MAKVAQFLMAASVLIPDNENAFRGMANANWSKRGVVSYKAYMLRPASDIFPIEEELSLGRTPETAVNELSTHFGAAALLVHDVHRLPYGLRVIEDPQNITKAYMNGLPLFSKDESLRERALAVAQDLASISCHVPVPTVSAPII